MLMIFLVIQLTMRSTTHYYSKGTIIADSHEPAKGLMVITSGLVNVELPMDSPDAVEDNCKDGGKTLLVVFGRGYSEYLLILSSILSTKHVAQRLCWR